MENLRDKYRWALDKIKSEFPDCKVTDQEFDLGASYAIAVKLNDKNHGIRIQYHLCTGGVYQWLEDDEGNKEWGLGPPFEYETKITGPEQVDQWIAKIKASKPT